MVTEPCKTHVDKLIDFHENFLNSNNKSLGDVSIIFNQIRKTKRSVDSTR